MRISPILSRQIAQAATNQPYRQIEALDTGRFAEWLTQRDVAISWQEIHHLWSIGLLHSLAVLQPAFDFIPEDRERFTAVDLGYEVEGFADCGSEPCEVNTFSPAANLPIELRELVLWHPFQLWTVADLYVPYKNYCSLQGWRNEPHDRSAQIRNAYQALHGILVNQQKNERHHEYLKVEALLLQVEPLVHAQLDTRVRTHPYAGESFDGYYVWANAQDGPGILTTVGLTVEQVTSWYESLVHAARSSDPLREWRFLMRHIRHGKREELKGVALRAHSLYDAAEILRRYLETYHAETLAERGIVLLEEHDMSKIGDPSEIRAFNQRFYTSARIADADRTVLRRIIREFDLDPQPRMTWFVEGDTEDAFLKHYAAAMHADLAKIGVEVMNVEGVGGLDSRRLRLLLDRFKREECFTFASVDADKRNDHIRQLRVFGRDEVLSLGWHLFEPDFEGANFTIEELVAVAKGMAAADGYELDLSVDRVRDRMDQTKEAVGKALENLASLAKGTAWGEALSQWAIEHEECPEELRDAQGNRPIKTLLLQARRAQTSSYYATVRDLKVDQNGKRVARSE